jgi:hypothetical protein
VAAHFGADQYVVRLPTRLGRRELCFQRSVDLAMLGAGGLLRNAVRRRPGPGGHRAISDSGTPRQVVGNTGNIAAGPVAHSMARKLGSHPPAVFRRASTPERQAPGPILRPASSRTFRVSEDLRTKA